MDEVIEFKLPPGCQIRWNSLTRNERWWGEDDVLIDLPGGKSIDVGFYGNDCFRVVVYQNQDWHDQVTDARTDNLDEVIRLVEDFAVRYSTGE